MHLPPKLFNSSSGQIYSCRYFQETWIKMDNIHPTHLQLSWF